jgi:hypothetical protein
MLPHPSITIGRAAEGLGQAWVSALIAAIAPAPARSIACACSYRFYLG